MDRIYRFDEFTLILESMENNDEELLRAIEKVVSRKRFVRLVASPKFGGVYTRPSKKYPDFEKIICRWDNKEFIIPKILYRDGDFYSTRQKDLSRSGDLNGIFKSGDQDYFNRVKYYLENFLWGLSSSVEPLAQINPFEHGVENMPIIKELESNGIRIISDDADKRLGRLILRFPNAVYDYVINKYGDIYRKKHSERIPNNREDYVDDDNNVTREELLKGIYKLDDLVPKIKFVYMLYLLDLAKNKGLPEELFKKLLSILGSGEGINNLSYKEKYNKIVKEYPQAALYLPEPEGGGDKGLIKGAKILGRMGVF